MLEIEIHRYPNIGVINLKGNFVLNEIKQFDTKIKDLKENYNEIGISFENVQFVDSSGLGLLVQLYKYLREKKDGELYIFGPTKEIKEVFDYSQLSKYFKILTKEEFRSEFIGYEYKLDFKVHKPKMDIVELSHCESAKISVNYLEQLLKENNADYYIEEDVSIYKRGKKLQKNDTEQLKKRGYDFIWISTDRHEAPEGTKEEIVRNVKRELETALYDFYKVFREDEVKKGTRGVLSYFNGKDLFKSQLNPLQREGAQKIYHKVFGDGGKLSNIKVLLEKIMMERITKVDLFSSYSMGSKEIQKGHPALSSKMDEITNRLIMHSVNCAITFIACCNRIYGQRAVRGQQISVQRLEKGEKRYDKNKRSLYQSDLILNAAFGILFHDFGYNHSELRKLIDKELDQFKDGNGDYIKDSSKRLSDEERVLLKRHVHVGFNILSSDHESMYASAIADNIVKFHHCFLDGNGYPDRKKYIEDGKEHFKVPLHELTRLFIIINFYDSLLSRRPYRLPMRRETLVKYIINHSIPNLDPLGKPDEVGIWDIDTTKRQSGLFDGFLVKEFFKTINVYKIGESVVLRNDKMGKHLFATVFQNNEKLPHRPIVNVYLENKWGKIDLSAGNYSKWYIDDLHETLILE